MARVSSSLQLVGSRHCGSGLILGKNSATLLKAFWLTDSIANKTEQNRTKLNQMPERRKVDLFSPELTGLYFNIPMSHAHSIGVDLRHLQKLHTVRQRRPTPPSSTSI